MAGVISYLKAQARILHRHIVDGESAAVVRAQRLAELRDYTAAEIAVHARRRHCLAVIANELGFHGWPHAVAVLSGKETSDFGTLLYPTGGEAHWNIWSASYEEAKAIRGQHGGYLLAYRRHYFITDRYFIETLGLSPDDPDWERIGRDWIKPNKMDARSRLYEQLIRRHITRAATGR